jgi:hypothetical protein
LDKVVIGGLLERVAGLFARRFVLNAFLPVLLLVGTTVAVTLFAIGALDVVAEAWKKLDGFGMVLVVLSCLTLTWFAAGVMTSQFRNLTQLYEGYPLGRWWKGVNSALVEYHFRRSQSWFRNPAKFDDAFYSYPEGPREDFLPTALGNVLRSAEYYPLYRYEIPTTFLWPRLFYVAPERFRRDIEEFRTDYEWLLGVSFLSVLATFVSALVQLLAGSQWWLFALTLGGGSLLALGAYRASVTAAEEYGAQLRAGVDLYRTDVLALLRWKVPDNLAQERQIWSEVRRFHLEREPRTRAYSPFNRTNDQQGDR